jgi:hypothetical protein
MRLRRYTKEERMALDHWEHEKGCRLQKKISSAVKESARK